MKLSDNEWRNNTGEKMKNYDIMTDEQLIRLLREGESSITDFLMDKYKFLVRKKAKAMYLLGGENDDLIQEGMIGLFKALQDYKPESGASFLSFADLCITRQMYSAIKASQRKKHMPLNSYISLYSSDSAENQEKTVPLIDTITDSLTNNPEQVLLGKEHAEIIENELKDKLSELENRVLYLHLMGTDYQTIAKLIDKSPKTVDNALQRIKAKTQDIIRKKE